MPEEKKVISQDYRTSSNMEVEVDTQCDTTRLDWLTYFFLFKFEQGDSICKELDVILGSLLRGALASQGVADLHALTVNHLISILLIVAHLLVVLLLVHVILVHLLVV